MYSVGGGCTGDERRFLITPELFPGAGLDGPERVRSPKKVRYWKFVAEALYLVLRVSAAVAGPSSRSGGEESIMKVMIRFGRWGAVTPLLTLADSDTTSASGGCSLEQNEDQSLVDWVEMEVLMMAMVVVLLIETLSFKYATWGTRNLYLRETHLRGREWIGWMVGRSVGADGCCW